MKGRLAGTRAMTTRNLAKAYIRLVFITPSLKAGLEMHKKVNGL